VFDSIKPQIAGALADAGREGIGDVHQLQQVVRRVVGRWAYNKLRRRPMIIPIVVET
jgi:ribonuclease J